MQSWWRRLRHNLGAFLGVLILTAVLLVAIVGPLLTRYNPLENDLLNTMKPPTAAHWLGTDDLGRDVLSRVVYGTRISFQAAFFVVVLAGLIGLALGAVAAYVGGWLDEVIMRSADVFLAFPSFLLAMAIAAALGPGITNAMFAIGVAWWPRYARLVRSAVISIREREFVTASVAMGAGHGRILLRHILPNSLAPLLVQGTMDAGMAILTTASLSFVGLGAAPPTPEWGAMVSQGRDFITVAWWIPTFPGLAIAITVMGYVFLGDGLRDLLDPKLRGRVGVAGQGGSRA